MATIKQYAFSASTSLADLAAVIGMSYDSTNGVFYKGSDTSNGFSVALSGTTLAIKGWVAGAALSSTASITSPLLYVSNAAGTAYVFGGTYSGSADLIFGWTAAVSADDSGTHYMFITSASGSGSLRTAWGDGVYNETAFSAAQQAKSDVLVSLSPLAMGVGTGGTANLYTTNYYVCTVGQQSSQRYQIFTLDGYEYVALRKGSAGAAPPVMRIGTA